MKAPSEGDRLRALILEFRGVVKAQHKACASGDTDALLTLALESETLAGRLGELVRRITETPGAGSQVLQQCQADSDALLRELDEVAEGLVASRNAAADELADLTRVAAATTFYTRETAPPVVLDRTG